MKKFSLILLSIILTGCGSQAAPITAEQATETQSGSATTVSEAPTGEGVPYGTEIEGITTTSVEWRGDLSKEELEQELGTSSSIAISNDGKSAIWNGEVYSIPDGFELYFVEKDGELVVWREDSLYNVYLLEQMNIERQSDFENKYAEDYLKSVGTVREALYNYAEEQGFSKEVTNSILYGTPYEPLEVKEPTQPIITSTGYTGELEIDQFGTYGLLGLPSFSSEVLCDDVSLIEFKDWTPSSVTCEWNIAERQGMLSSAAGNETIFETAKSVLERTIDGEILDYKDGKVYTRYTVYELEFGPGKALVGISFDTEYNGEPLSMKITIE